MWICNASQSSGVQMKSYCMKVAVIARVVKFQLTAAGKRYQTFLVTRMVLVI